MKKIIKKILYFSLFYSCFFNLLLKVLRKVQNDYPCVILLYHKIVDDNSKYLYQGPVMHHQVKDFEKEMQYLKKNYELLSMDEVVHSLKIGLGFKRPTVSITFDDGYLDNYTLAYPILKKYRIPAIIYVTSDAIGTSEGTWPNQIELAFLETRKEQFSHRALLGDEIVKIKTIKEKENANLKVLQALKLKPDNERKEMTKEIVETLGVDSDFVKNLGPRIMLSWDELREMKEYGVTIGSHSHTHPILSRMPLQKAKEDILTSKKIIEENLGIKVKHFAFPNGREEDFSEELRQYCRKIPFESVASVIFGTNDASNGNAYNLKRIGSNSPVWILAGELLKHFLKRSLRNGKWSFNR